MCFFFRCAGDFFPDAKRVIYDRTVVGPSLLKTRRLIFVHGREIFICVGFRHTYSVLLRCYLTKHSDHQ